MYSTRATICLVISLFSVVSKCKGEGYKPAPNCARTDCPVYTVIHSEKEFEIRSYKNAKWVFSREVSYNSYSQAASKGFPMLAAYFNGENREHMKMNMTFPVVVGMENSVYRVYFYVPVEYHIYTPRSFTNKIDTTYLPGHKYAAVRKFDGIINDAVIPKQIDALKKSLQSTPYKGAAVEGKFLIASYNSPVDLTAHVNEVVLLFD